MFGHDNQQQDDQVQNQQLVSDPLATELNEDKPAAAATAPDDAPATEPEDKPADDHSVGGQASSFVMTDTPQDHSSAGAGSVPAVGPSDDLLSIKQQALQQLSPLVSHLDQTPEEKFRTTMMMIQASDDQTLVKDAYEAARQITDEKAKAQALLDIVNEINYFTQQHNQ